MLECLDKPEGLIEIYKHVGDEPGMSAAGVAEFLADPADGCQTACKCQESSL